MHAETLQNQCICRGTIDMKSQVNHPYLNNSSIFPPKHNSKHRKDKFIIYEQLQGEQDENKCNKISTN